MIYAVTPEMLREVFEPLNIKSRDYIFLPINNNENITSTGGSHWSLLLYSVKENIYSYYDSFNTMNLKHASIISQKFSAAIGFQNNNTSNNILNGVKFSATSNTRLIGNVSNFNTCNAPQQVNGYDCGVYVLAIARRIAYAITEQQDITKCLGDITPSFIKHMRQEILETINDLVNKKSEK